MIETLKPAVVARSAVGPGCGSGYEILLQVGGQQQQQACPHVKRAGRPRGVDVRVCGCVYQRVCTHAREAQG